MLKHVKEKMTSRRGREATALSTNVKGEAGHAKREGMSINGSVG